MAGESSNSSWAWPFSGNVLQDYHPWTSWFRTTMGQFGFININEMQSNDPDLERRIVTGVGSYGKQLGRVIEALQAVCEHLEAGGWTPDGRESVKSFLRLADEIDALKSAHQPVAKGTIDQLVAALRHLKEQDRAVYERVESRLRVE